MPALNRVQVIGRLGRDPDSHFTPTGKKVTQFTLAVNNQWNRDEGEPKEYTEWVQVESWGRLAETCQAYLRKGSLIYLEGRMKTNKYDVNGEPRYFTKVVASAFEFLDGKPAGEPRVAEEQDAGAFEP
jgi:single-strand DNA-binding protein